MRLVHRLSLTVITVAVASIFYFFCKHGGLDLVKDMYKDFTKEKPGRIRTAETPLKIWNSPEMPIPRRRDPDDDKSFDPRKVAIAIRAIRAWFIDIGDAPQPIRTEKTEMFLNAHKIMREVLWDRYIFYICRVWLTDPEWIYVKNLKEKDPLGLAPTTSIPRFKEAGDLEGLVPQEFRGRFSIKSYGPVGAKFLQIQISEDIVARLKERVQSPRASISKGMHPEAVPNGYVKEPADFYLKWWDGLPKEWKPPIQKRKSVSRKKK